MISLAPGWFLLVGLLGMLLSRLLPRLGDDPRQQQLNRFRAGLCGFAAATFYLWLCLPAFPFFGVSGRPEGVADVANQEKLLNYLQEYNDTLTRTTEVVHWFVFLFLFWFLFGILNLSSEAAKLIGKPGVKEAGGTSPGSPPEG